MEIKEAINLEISCANDVYNIFNYLNKEEQELFLTISLNTKNKIINTHITAIGTLDNAIVHSRDIFREAIRNNANGIILVHNHPSGDCNPSKEDIEVTERLEEIGEMLNIKILDHIIIGKEKLWSWRDKEKLLSCI